MPRDFHIAKTGSDANRGSASDPLLTISEGAQRAQPGINFITVQGFVMRHAATPWAPPTAEQVGLIGTHWSKGWIIENNEISHSRCVGITFEKYGDEWDNQSANTAEGYILTVQRALDKSWSKDCIGHHIVRNNRISHCEQAGIVGSLGAAFSEISGNTVFEIHQRKAFDGAEQGAIKIHGAIDTVIRGNHIYRSHWGTWDKLSDRFIVALLPTCSENITSSHRRRTVRGGGTHRV